MEITHSARTTKVTLRLLSNKPKARPVSQYSVDSTAGPWEERGKQTRPDDRLFAQRPFIVPLLSTIKIL